MALLLALGMVVSMGLMCTGCVRININKTEGKDTIDYNVEFQEEGPQNLGKYADFLAHYEDYPMDF